MYRITTGHSRTDLHWTTRPVEWSVLAQRLSQCRRTPESVREYQAMSKDAKGQVKDIGGFVGGALDGTGRRKADTVVSRSLVTLDIDYAVKDTVGIVKDALVGYEWALYSTHSHTPETPRYRLVVPLDREVTPDEYIPIARRVAALIGIDTFDDSTYEPSRLMYWPSASRDGDFVYEEGHGCEVGADELLATYADWSDVSEWPVSSRVQRLVRKDGRRQEDPTAKGGLIGAFCRAYGIAEAIEAFLPDVYEETAARDRYTYRGGSTACGAIVYEDKWIYSHHATDPAGQRLLNAFDLVRIHRFGDLDAVADDSTPVNRLPSFEAMEQFVRNDRKTSKIMTEDKLAELGNDFGDLGGGEDEAGDTEWLARLKKDRKGNILVTPDNAQIILANDQRFAGCVRRDVFHGHDAIIRDLPWRKRSESATWLNSDDSSLIVWLSRYYGLNTGKNVILDALEATVARDWFHPVRDYLNGLPEWDGEERLDTLLVDYMGAEDCVLTRALTRKHFTAAVARVFEPGCKYDNVLTLVGSEGLGKSTLIRRMGLGRWTDDSFSCGAIGDKEAMEQLKGRWLVELAELKDVKKSTNEAVKAFLSKQVDEYRPAYGRKSEKVPRQCVFFATTNEDAFLRGDTGNRRFWPVHVGADMPTKDVFALDEQTVGQIWAEALMRYRSGERLYLSAELEASARVRQAEFNELSADDRKGLIEAFLRKRLPCDWWKLTRRQRQNFFFTSEVKEGEPYLERETISVIEIQEECLGEKPDRYKAREIAQILKSLGLEPMGVTRNAHTDGDGRWVGDTEYGPQRRYRVCADVLQG